jgi:monoamine oxidase
LQDASRKSSVLKCLAQFFGEQVHDYIDYAEKDWEAEPYVGGAPVCVAGPGAMKYYTVGLREPFKW